MCTADLVYAVLANDLAELGHSLQHDVLRLAPSILPRNRNAVPALGDTICELAIG